MAKKNKKNCYEFGSFVKANASGIGSAGQFAAGALDTFKNPNKANIGLSAGQGALSGASAGAALGPLGMLGGALIGGAFGLAGGIKQKQQIDNQRDATYGDLRGQQSTGMSTANVNPYGTQIYAFGGEVDIDPTSRQQWNGFVDFVAAKGLKGSPKLDQRDTNLSKKLFEEYSKQNKLQLNYDEFIPKVQQDISNYRTKALEQIKSGKAVFNGAEEDFMPGLSNVDGWAGSRTTSYKFPSDKIVNPATNTPIAPNTVYPKLANGGQINQNIINIEKGELQIDTNSGKILREYKGVNPESAGLYQPHAKKGKDTDNNFVTAEPGTFIITKAKAGKYKKAIDNNDKLAQQSILQNIRNYKSTVENGKLKFANGSDVKNPYLPNNYLATSGIQPTPTYGLTASSAQFKPTTFTPGAPIVPSKISNGMQVTDMLYKPSGTPYVPDPSMLTKGLNAVSKYGPAAFNIARGMFGKAEQERYGTKAINPYLNQIQANMPKDIDMQPIYNDIYSQQRVGVQDLRNNSNNSAVYRANRQNITANTQRQISGARLQGQMANNQIRGQRSSIYAGLGAQDMQEQQRLQQYNLGINQINAQNRGAKQNLLGKGLSQLQQVNQNDKFNAKQYEMQMLQYKLLPQIYANWKYYSPEYDNLLKKK